MPVPITKQLINNFLGLQEGQHSTAMSDVFSSSGSVNVWMDRWARVQKILGYAKATSSAYTTNTGGSATRLGMLAPYRKVTSGAFTRHVVGIFTDDSDEVEICTSTDTGATWTFRQDLGSSAVGKQYDYMQFGNELFITNGAVTPRVWNGTAVSTAGATQSPTPAVAESSTAGDLNGTYQAKLVSLETGQDRHPGSAVSTAVQIENKRADITWTADTDTDVTGYELYMTTGTGLAFYFVAMIDGRTTASYTYTGSDEEIRGGRSLREHGDAPPAAYWVTAHKQRAWYGRTDAHPRRDFISDPDNPDSTWHSNNYIDYDDSQSMGDVMTGSYGEFQGMKVTFLERSIWTVSGSGEISGNEVDWNKRRAQCTAGATGQQAIVKLPAGAVYFDQFGEQQSTADVALAYWTPQGDIRLFDGDRDIVISAPVTDSIDSFNYAERTKIWALHDPTRFHVTWFYPDADSTTCNTAVTWNYRFGAWYKYTPQPFSAGVCLETATSSAVCIAGQAATAEGGHVYTLWSGNTFDGSDITSTFFTKPLFGVVSESFTSIPQIAPTKRWRYTEVVMAGAAAKDVTVSWFKNLASDDESPDGTSSVNIIDGISVLSADGDVIVSASGDDIQSSDASVFARILHKDTSGSYMLSNAMRLRISDTSSGLPWSLEALTLAFQILPGVRKYQS
jgi:hypothetical protein